MRLKNEIKEFELHQRIDHFPAIANDGEEIFTLARLIIAPSQGTLKAVWTIAIVVYTRRGYGLRVSPFREEFDQHPP
jgi:hypothetical protein